MDPRRLPATSTGHGASPSLHVVTNGGPSRGNTLRRALYLVDLLSVTVAWAITIWWPGAVGDGPGNRPVALLGVQIAITGFSILAIASQRLYLARVSGVRSVEAARLARACALSGVAAYGVGALIDAPISVLRASFGALLAFMLLSSARGLYTSWLKSARMQGRFCRPMVLVGTNEHAEDIARLIEAHPETGFRLVGVVGSSEELSSWDQPLPWLGPLSDAADLTRVNGANGVVVATSAVPREDLDPVCRSLLDAGIHVHLHVLSGLEGIATRRLRPLPLAYEPLFYLEPLQLSAWQRTAKRVLDITLALVGLIFLSPVFGAAALAVKLQDRHSVFFRQIRVGRDGKPFVMLKFRTMIPDAEQKRDVLMTNNERTGPLFKLAKDPRRTKVGRILEASSIDEMPNLINVLKGEMSIVGPRPALPSEVAQFDDDLLARLTVPPGITGLWQVEARENPSFHAYKRLDLFYVENWSLALDVAIIAGTIKTVLLRVVKRRSSQPASAEAAGPDLASAGPDLDGPPRATQPTS